MFTTFDSRSATPAATMAATARVRTSSWQADPMFSANGAIAAYIAKHLTPRRPPGPPT